MEAGGGQKFSVGDQAPTAPYLATGLIPNKVSRNLCLLFNGLSTSLCTLYVIFIASLKQIDISAKCPTANAQCHCMSQRIILNEFRHTEHG